MCKVIAFVVCAWYSFAIRNWCYCLPRSGSWNFAVGLYLSRCDKTYFRIRKYWFVIFARMRKSCWCCSRFALSKSFFPTVPREWESIDYLFAIRSIFVVVMVKIFSLYSAHRYLNLCVHASLDKLWMGRGVCNAFAWFPLKDSNRSSVTFSWLPPHYMLWWW